MFAFLTMLSGYFATVFAAVATGCGGRQKKYVLVARRTQLRQAMNKQFRKELEVL